MKLQFLGTGAAEGAPAIFCKCDTCQELRRRGEEEYHTYGWLRAYSPPLFKAA